MFLELLMDNMIMQAIGTALPLHRLSINPQIKLLIRSRVDLYITNLGAHAPSYLYRIVADHYKTEDINFQELLF